MSTRVLVIDDDHTILELFRFILEEEGYEVHLSPFAFEDILDVENVHPHLILLDVKIGHLNEGWVLLQKLKRYRPTKDIPLIVCTGSLDGREEKAILRQRGIPIVYRPFDLDKLLQVVHQCLSPLQSSLSL